MARNPFGFRISHPVAVRVLDERQALHLAVVGALHELDPEALEPLAGGMDVGHGDTDVSESLRRGVAVVVPIELRIRLRAPVVGQLHQRGSGEEPLGPLANLLGDLLTIGQVPMK